MALKYTKYTMKCSKTNKTVLQIYCDFERFQDCFYWIENVAK